MTTPGSTATQMYMAMRDIESALQRLASALNLPAYETPPARYRDRAYADMVRMRSLAAYLNDAVAKLEVQHVEVAPLKLDVMQTVLAHVLNMLTKAQLLSLASDFGVFDLSDSQRKEELVDALTDALLPQDDGAPDDAPESDEAEAE